MNSSTRPIQIVSNTELYNRWAKVYDTDNNILQAIDDTLITPLLLTAFAQLSTPSPPSSLPSSPITITELGCGTGRNTSKLLLPPFTPSHNATQIQQINALDLSHGMLDISRSRCAQILSQAQTPEGKCPDVRFLEFDVLHPEKYEAVKELEGKADLVLSTLVLEHLPLDIFVRTVNTLLKPTGGVLVLTNMHAEMGRMGQAGFVDDNGAEQGVGEGQGIKVRGESFVYEIDEVLEKIQKCGGRVVGEVQERKVDRGDVEGSGVLAQGGRGEKWVGVKVWFGLVVRFGGE